MGVHGLWELLAPVGRRVSVELLGNRKLAIDASIWIVQFLKAMRDERGDVVRNAHLLGFFRRICKLMFLRVKPVFVFDGGTPYLKRKTVIARRRQREQAQSKIRKTAEKLLLNHLKAKKLEELVREEEQGTSQQQTAKEKDDKTPISAEEQERADALLASSLAKEWEEEDVIAMEDDSEEQILPVVQGKVDPSVLASLPPSMQLRLLDEMREQLVAENRQKFEKVAKAPASFSKLQIEAYLKTVAFRRDINQVQSAAAHLNAEGVPSARIASEANRQYIFSSENGQRSARDSSNETRRDESGPSSEAMQDPTLDPQEKPAGEVQTYLSEKGKKRVSRIRGMGVRMTRDLQWNLYLMKDKEARDAETIDINQGDAQDMDDQNAAFEKLVSERRDDETDIEWEEQDEAVSAADETGDMSAQEKEKSLHISFVDDGSLHADDLFEKLVLESQPEEPQENRVLESQPEEPQDVEEIEWEEDSSARAVETNIPLTAESGEQTMKSSSIQVTFEDDGVLQEDDKFQSLISEANEDVDWEEGAPEQRCSSFDPPAVVVTEVRERNEPKMDKISEEQAQIEEAIRRSLLDYGPRKVLKPLTIQEPSSDQLNVTVDDQRDVTHKSAEEEERARKGKGLMYEESLEASPNVRLESDEKKEAHIAESNIQDRSEVHESPSRFRAATEEEERFFEAEESSVRRAFFEDQRDKLVEEEAQLRAEQKRNERNAESVTNEMFAECQELLQLFGLPYVIAPMEAEAQCAFMDSASLVDGVITDDSDVFLFGGRSVYKNIFDGHKYVETYYMKDAETDLGLNRDKLIRMAMLLGSDYTEGISGIGIVNAIEVVNAFPEEDGLKKLREWIESPDLMLLDKIQPWTEKSRKPKSSKKTTDSQQEEKDETVEEDPTTDLDEKKRMFMQKHRAVSKNWTVPDSFPSMAVFDAYTSPQVDNSTETFSWGRPDLDMLRKFCFEKFGWSKGKADELLLPALKEYDRRETQLRLDAFYSFNQRFAKIRSTRIQKAVAGITGQRNPEMMFGSTETPTSKRKPRKQKSENGASKPNKKRKAGTTNMDGEQTDKKPRKRQSKKMTNGTSPGMEGLSEYGNVENVSDVTMNTGAGGAEALACAAGGGFVMEDETQCSDIQTAPMDRVAGGGGGFVVEDETMSGNVGNVNDQGKMKGNEENGNGGLSAIPNFRKRRKSYGD